MYVQKCTAPFNKLNALNNININNFYIKLSLKSVTNVPHFFSRTNLALNLTAPVKYTTTPFLHCVLTGGIATPTTHKVTAFYSNRSCIAFPPLCSLEINRCVFITETRGVLKINKVTSSGRFMIWIHWSKSKSIFPSLLFSFL